MANRAITFADGNTLTAANMTQLQKQAVINCDAAVDYPGTPAEGQFIYDVALDSLLQYTTATTGWRPPWNLPWGRLGGAAITANSNAVASATPTDTTGLTTGSITYVANRRIQVTVHGQVSSSNAEGCLIQIVNGSGTVVMAGNVYSHSSNWGTYFTSTASITTTAGAQTYKVQHCRSFGATGNITILAAATSPATITVTDIGPAAAPA